MKKVSFALIGLVSAVSAFPGITGDQGLHRTEAGKTGGADRLDIVLGYEGSYGTDVLVDKNIVTTNADGSTSNSTVSKLYSATYNLGLVLGIDKDWDAGVTLPVHHDWVEYASGPVANLAKTSKSSLGDLRFWTRHRLPITDRKGPWNWAVSANGSMNTGSEEIGLLPKRVSHLPLDASQKMDPNSAGVSTLGAGLALTFDGSKVESGWSFHTSVSGRKPTYLEMSGSTLWGAGFEYDWTNVGVFLEYAGETRWSSALIDDPNWITPGIRFHFENGLNLSMAADWNPTYDRLARSYVIDRYVADGVSSKVNANASNPWGASAVFSWFIDLMGDEDGDGVKDSFDRCPHTIGGARVNAQGCELDQDKDGVVDRLDFCPDTPEGRKVDSKGCELDADQDRVVDALDQCPGTPLGRVVNEVGCELDADKDGIVDGLDQCPGTPLGRKVNEVGCELDADKDGVVDGLDQCPGTPLGRKVNEVGCELDSDGDGVWDSQDLCPGTAAGTKVNRQGCPEKIMRDLSKLQSAINYKTGSAELLPSSIPVLDKVVDLIKSLGDVKLRIEGHTDNVGKVDMNMKLSQDRAQSVVDYLVAKGIKSTNLEAKGFGPTKPIISNATAAGRAKNRRTEINPVEGQE